MTKICRSRREFLGLTGAGLAAAGIPRLDAIPVAAAAAEPQDADLVVFNAKVYTVDDVMPTAEASCGSAAAAATGIAPSRGMPAAARPAPVRPKNSRRLRRIFVITCSCPLVAQRGKVATKKMGVNRSEWATAD